MFIKTPDISEYCNKLIQSYYDLTSQRQHLEILNKDNYASFKILSDTSALVFINILFSIDGGRGLISKELYVTYTNNLFNGLFNVVSL